MFTVLEIKVTDMKSETCVKKLSRGMLLYYKTSFEFCSFFFFNSLFPILKIKITVPKTEHVLTNFVIYCF